MNPKPNKVSECRAEVDKDGKAVIVFSAAKRTALNPTVLARTLSNAGNLGPVLQISEPPELGTAAELDIDAAGNAVFVWTNIEADGSTVVRTRTLSSEGTLTPIQTVSADSFNPHVAVTLDGTAFFIWERHSQIETRALPVGGPLGPVQTISDVGSEAHDPRIVVSGAGRAVAMWANFTTFRLQGAVSQ